MPKRKEGNSQHARTLIHSGSNMPAQFEERHLKFNHQPTNQPTTMNEEERIKRRRKYIMNIGERIREREKFISNEEMIKRGEKYIHFWINEPLAHFIFGESNPFSL